MVWQFGMVWLGLVWQGLLGGGVFGNVLEYSRMLRETQKSFMGGGGGGGILAIIVSTQVQTS